eukprot:7159971-Prymnesium_polylepis.1
MSEGGGVDCNAICFNMGKCIDTCQKIKGAMANSTGFPCIAAGLCPEVDEFGDVSCKFSYKSMNCEPSNACEYKFPKCELRAGIKKWKKVGRLVSDQLGALDDALRYRKRCSEPGAGPFCIMEAHGLGLAAEWAGLVVTFLAGSFLSIRAIETPGGDDDRQWLTFWIIFFFFTIVERYADVLLSRAPRYYEGKFVLLLWLMFYEGADKIYRLVRQTLKKINRLLPIIRKVKQLTEEQYVHTLPWKMRRKAKQLGLRPLMEQFRCDADIAGAYDLGVLYQLWAMWNKVRRSRARAGRRTARHSTTAFTPPLVGREERSRQTLLPPLLH